MFVQLMSDRSPACPLAIIVPVYRNADTLEALAERVQTALRGRADGYRLLFVVDASPDRSRQVVDKLASEHPWIEAVLLEENVGQQRALLAGLHHVRADYYAVMDADLQDPPELLPDLLSRARARNESVFAVREGQYQHWRRMLSSRLFKSLIAFLVGLPANAGTYLVVPQEVARRMLEVEFSHVHVPIMAYHLSCSRSCLPYRRYRRPQGNSAYSSAGRVAAAWNALRCALLCRMSGPQHTSGRRH